MKSGTNEPQDIKFSKNGYHFNGSKIDQYFSFSKIGFALQRNIHADQKQETNIQPPSQKSQQGFNPNHVTETNELIKNGFQKQQEQLPDLQQIL